MGGCIECELTTLANIYSIRLTETAVILVGLLLAGKRMINHAVNKDNNNNNKFLKFI